eukprot:TRINITY_DN30903_c0_g1_i1.p2 TRINITY_DN30903_c0_g1~~TRINITY_DN30903_c0_g1_i1.p2  ORF type:complete len:130 (+),score=13.10 TRINITY_DN30903_c0_g1_i1:334-723(+)
MPSSVAAVLAKLITLAALAFSSSLALAALAFSSSSALAFFAFSSSLALPAFAFSTFCDLATVQFPLDIESLWQLVQAGVQYRQERQSGTQDVRRADFVSEARCYHAGNIARPCQQCCNKASFDASKLPT